LDSTSTVPERIAGLQCCGFTRGEIATAVGVSSDEAVRLWQRGERQLRGRTYSLLDALRYTVRCLVQAGLAPDRARAWFGGRHTMLDHQTPLVHLAQDPDRVLAAALADTRSMRRKLARK
jgi:hypothetical protein